MKSKNTSVCEGQISIEEYIASLPEEKPQEVEDEKPKYWWQDERF